MRVGGVWCRRQMATRATGSSFHPVCDAFHAIIRQQSTLLHQLSDDEYTYRCPTLQGTTGGHVRHALDHLRRSIDLSADAAIHYDVRDRLTRIETNRVAAMDEMNAIRALAARVADDKFLARHVHAAFRLSAEGEEVTLRSTVEREMAFAVHHAIHHHALIKVILTTHFPHVPLPFSFGVAPSTVHYEAHLAKPSS
ncbi:hypothetical protein H257_11560 [Aphanomyces astaci]|uniref:DinB-like domain-containing protein n=1 Tax=Aphanomyces astaci TaxID=112090 RepID=W4G125_APHAT|nr:hypothetical protein H257_11560 [Aphanomyces astaci]ETV73412.1 hypothetical protein H257_11560 [Aphanomyces astaci]|eukprot:XP_009836838.1 hypothetical protein H257_11560 [Aphanomyces astaci]